MKFFRTAKTLLTWQEPILFAARTRDRRGWMLRGLLASLIFAVMVFGMYADRNWGGRGPARKFSVAGGVLLSALIGLFLTSLLDAPDLNRQVTISDDSISSFGNAGHHVSMTT